MSQPQRRSRPRVEIDSAGPDDPLSWTMETDSIDGAMIDSGLGSLGGESLISAASFDSTSNTVLSNFSQLSVSHPAATTSSTEYSSNNNSDASDSTAAMPANNNRSDTTRLQPNLNDNAKNSEITTSIDDEAYFSGSVHSSYLSSGGSEEQERKRKEAEKTFIQDEDGDTQLHIAIIQRMGMVAKYFIDLAADPSQLDIQNDLLQTPLHLASLTNQPEVVRKLVVCRAPLDTRDHAGNTALHLACREGHIDVVTALCSRVESQEILALCPGHRYMEYVPKNLTRIYNYDGDSCMHLAAAQGHMRVLAYLVGRSGGGNINCKDGRSGRTVLHHAVESNCKDVVFFVVRHCGADVNSRTFDGATPLMLAHGRGFSYLQTFLTNMGSDPNQIGLDDYTDSEDEEMMEEHGFLETQGAFAIST